MDNSRIVFLINDQVRAVKAKYEDTGSAEMFKTFDPTIKVGDLAVVQSNTRHMMTVVKITEADVDVNFDSTTTIHWIVQKIDAPAFDTVLAQEAQAIPPCSKPNCAGRRKNFARRCSRTMRRALRPWP